MTIIDGVAAEDRPTCAVCGAPGAILWEGVRDHLFGAPGVWSVKQCVDPRCRACWLHPFPLPGEEAKFYQNYYTHANKPPGGEDAPAAYAGESGAKRFARAVLQRIHWRPEIFAPDLFYLGARPPGALLDVGCGDGSFLRKAAARGWRARGIDFDEAAARAAREKGVEVDCGGLVEAGYEANSFDAVTLNNVIEHLQNPAEVIAEARRILRPGGVLVMATPNVLSYGHRCFGRHWRGLEIPRHLFLFSPAILRRLCREAGFARIAAFSTPNGAGGAAMMAEASKFIEWVDAHPDRPPQEAPRADMRAWGRRAFLRWLAGFGDGEMAICIAYKD